MLAHLKRESETEAQWKGWNLWNQDPQDPRFGSSQREGGIWTGEGADFVWLPSHPLNYRCEGIIWLSAWKISKGGRGAQVGSKEEGVGQERGGEAGGGEESTLASPCAGQRSDEGRVRLHCLIFAWFVLFLFLLVFLMIFPTMYSCFNCLPFSTICQLFTMSFGGMKLIYRVPQKKRYIAFCS